MTCTYDKDELSFF
jgi:hypothetical protein